MDDWDEDDIIVTVDQDDLVAADFFGIKAPANVGKNMHGMTTTEEQDWLGMPPVHGCRR